MHTLDLLAAGQVIIGLRKPKEQCYFTFQHHCLSPWAIKQRQSSNLVAETAASWIDESLLSGLALPGKGMWLMPGVTDQWSQRPGLCPRGS